MTGVTGACVDLDDPDRLPGAYIHKGVARANRPYVPGELLESGATQIIEHAGGKLPIRWKTGATGDVSRVVASGCLMFYKRVGRDSVVGGCNTKITKYYDTMRYEVYTTKSIRCHESLCFNDEVDNWRDGA